MTTGRCAACKLEDKPCEGRTFHVRAVTHSCSGVAVQLGWPISSQQSMLCAQAPGQSVHRVMETEREGISFSPTLIAMIPAELTT